MSDETEKEARAFLVKDYELKVTYLKDHYSRSLTRFNFFLTINSGLFAFVFKGAEYVDAVLVCAGGIALCLGWFAFSAADGYVGRAYREAIRLSLENIKLKFGDVVPSTLAHVGNTGYWHERKKGKKAAAANEAGVKVKPGCLSRKLLDLGVTKIGAVTALLFLFAWGASVVLTLWHGPPQEPQERQDATPCCCCAAP